jgi:hypothetical protein
MLNVAIAVIGGQSDVEFFNTIVDNSHVLGVTVNVAISSESVSLCDLVTRPCQEERVDDALPPKKHISKSP